jgi:hypothetical protein
MYFQKTNIADPIWNLESIVIPEAGLRLYEKHFINVEDIIPADLLEKFKAIDMPPEYVRLFVWPKNHCGIWHIDGTADTYRHSAINWILQGSGLIQFNNSLELQPMPGVHLGKRSTLAENAEAETTGHGCVVNTGACHRVITGQDGRTTISIGWKTNDTPFPAMLEKLRQINII